MTGYSLSTYLAGLFFGVLVTVALVPLLCRLQIGIPMDMPDGKRKVHSRPIPRIGGLAMASAFFVAALLLVHRDQFISSVLLGSGIIFGMGFLDDLKQLGYKSKFAAQIVAALVVIFMGRVMIIDLGSLLPHELCLSDIGAVLLTLIIIVGVTNAINLADGLDGLAAGISLLSFGALIYLGVITGQHDVAILATIISGCLIGFLRFNTYPASIFMGDSGSQLIGFVGIVLAIKLTQNMAGLSPVLPIILFGLPVLDTLAVMTQRILEGHSPFHADRNHIHHKLMNRGLYHREAVAVIYLMQGILITMAMIFCYGPEWPLLAGYAVFSLTVLFFFTWTESHEITIPRYGFLVLSKRYLKRIKRKGIAIKVIFALFRVSLLFLLFFVVGLVAEIPRPVAWMAVLMVVLLPVIFIFDNRQWLGTLVRLSVYLLLPCLIYYVDNSQIVTGNHLVMILWNGCFSLVGIFFVLTLKFTRRQKGFQFSTMDILVLLAILAVGILPDSRLEAYHLGSVAWKVMVLFFSFEVLAGELRGEWRGVAVTVWFMALMAAIKGFLVV